IRANYSRSALYLATTLLFAANTFNLGVDLGAMAQAVKLLWPSGNFLLLVFGFAVLSLLAEIFISYKTYARYLKYMALILFSYVASALLARLDWGTVSLHAFLPSFHLAKSEIIIVTAVLGTTISPYLFFWQTSQEVEEEILRGKSTVEERRAETS